MESGMDWQALGVSLRLAAATTAILFVVGLPWAWWLATTRWRGRFLIEALVALPMVLPPTVLGFYLLLLLGPRSPLGGAVVAITGERLPFTFTGILIGSVIANVPFAIRPFAAAFASVDRRLLEASWCLGQSPVATFRRVALPLAWPGVLAGLVLTFAHVLGEFGVVLMIGGNIQGVTRTLSVSIYDDVFHSLDYAGAQHSALFLLGFAAVVLCLAQWLSRRGLPA
jgi:molybdate transport system permease protein